MNEQNQHWADLFQMVFGANTENWGTTLESWNDLFHAEGRSNSELLAVVHSIAKRRIIPKFAPDFLQAIREELRLQDESMRANQETRRLEDLHKPTKCLLCKDSGWVCGLPHIATVFGFEWKKPRAEMAVTCKCGLGRHINGKWASAQPNPKTVMGFDEYAEKNPHWRGQLELRQKERAAEMAANNHQNGNPAWKAVTDRILATLQARQQALPEHPHQNI